MLNLLKSSSVITQQIKYYIKDRSGNFKLFNDVIDIPKIGDFKINSHLIKRLYNKYLSNKLLNNFMNSYAFIYLSGSEGLWLPSLFILWGGNNVKVEIITSAFKKIEYTEKTEDQVYRNNDTGTCLYDGLIQYFKNKIKDRNAKKNI